MIQFVIGVDFGQRVIRVVKQIPKGRVATYGQIASRLGAPRAARQVGKVLHGLLSATDVPWQRVINREGRISIIHEQISARMQADLLQKEGVEVVKRENCYCVDLGTHLWQPDNKVVYKSEMRV